MDEVLKYDDVGQNPHLAIRLCDTAIFLADRNLITRPIVKLLEDVSSAFRQTIETGA